MKKIMIAAAALATAYMTQAASVSWQYNGDSAAAGQTVYLILGDTPATEWTDQASVAAAALDGGTGTIAKHSKKYYADGTATGDFGYDASFYAVLVNADGTQWATTAAFAPGETYISAGQDPAKSAYDALSFGAFQDWKSGPGPGPDPTPEPTTGMLMLVGLAGLALRRRHV